MSFETEIQNAIYSRLDSQLSVPVYDDVPQSSANANPFPYVSIGSDTHIPWDTDSELGDEATITIHTWSRERGYKELKEIQGNIYDALHRYNLSVTGYHLVGVEWEFSEQLLDPDGLTRNGIQRFRITIEES